MSEDKKSYPVETVLPVLLDHLRANSNAVLIAPPGAGKTTLVAPALLGENWCNGQVLLLSPRRIAARMAAERIAEITGDAVGATIGYATRLDSKSSARTQILVMTEGIFRNRIITDPELSGISAVLFDEVHERSIDSDFGLALALEAQAAFRPDLRIIAMSATLDGERFSALLQGAPVICSDGKSWALETRYLGRRAELPIEQDVALAVRTVVRETAGDILVFLPGVREIERTAELLSNMPGAIIVHQLHGNLDPAVQRAALRRDSGQGRKVILATNIAETSLTIDGVRIVIDCGLARRARFDKAAGVTRLVTERASLSAITQRAGRAARQGPGTVYRLWQAAANGGLPPFDPPEILESDLSALLLDCASWGENDPGRLRWLDPPPQAAIDQARTALQNLGAIDAAGRITGHGGQISTIALPPHLAHMVVVASAKGQGERAAMLAILLQERGLGGPGEDVETRLDQFTKDQGARAQAARALARRLAKMVPQGSFAKPLNVGALIALAYPDRVAKRRDAKGENWLSVMGRGLRLDPSSRLARASYLAVADMQGAASGARIVSAAVIEEAEIIALLAADINTSTDIAYNDGADRVEARQRRTLGAIVLNEAIMSSPDPALVADALFRAVLDADIDILPWPKSALAFRQRAEFAGLDQLSAQELRASASQWLLPLLGGKNRLRDIDGNALHHAIENIIGWHGQQRIDQIAPPRFKSPAGTEHDIDYAALAGPTVALRVQALFGLDTHPVIGVDAIPLIVTLTSPAGRPIQTTQDLPAFWRGSWGDVAREMRGRYPKHHWPDVPWQAQPSLKTKKAQMRDT